MKKIFMIAFAILMSCFALSGCGEKEANEIVEVFSFSGEHELFSITNGVFVLTPTQEIFYGGKLEGELSNITAYTMTFYVQSGDEKFVLLSNRAKDMSGKTVNVFGEIGVVTGDVLQAAEVSDFQEDLYFELNTTDLSEGENTYRMKLEVTEITKTEN